MRIWILNNYSSPPDKAAGTRHCDFGRVLAEQGAKVTIFASSYNHLSRREVRFLSGARLRVEWFDNVRFVKSLDYIARRGISREKIAYIPNEIAGVPSADKTLSGSAAELAARIRQLRRGSRGVAGYVGSHGRANALGTLVHPARELRDRGEDEIVFVFVGDGPEKETCQRLARYRDLHNVIFAQYQNHNVTALAERFPQTLVQAQR